MLRATGAFGALSSLIELCRQKVDFILEALTARGLSEADTDEDDTPETTTSSS